MPAKLDDDTLQQIADHLIDVHRNDSLVHAIALGRIVIERVFGGDIERWRKKRDPDSSVRKLAKLVSAARDAPLSSTQLYNGLHAYDLDCRHGLSNRAHVTLRHAMTVKRLPASEQEHWLKQISKDKLSVDELRAKAGLPPERKPEKRPAPTFEETLDAHLPRLTSAPPEQLPANIEHLERLQKKIADALKDARARLPQPVSARKQAEPEPLPPEPSPSPPAFVLTGDYAQAEAARGAATAVLHQPLAGVDAPEAPPPHPVAAAFLDRAERSADALEIRFAPTLPGVLDACVAAEIVAQRPALAERTTVSLDRVAPLAEALPTLRTIWSAFRAPEPGPWLALRESVPGLRGAVERWLHELPHHETGLSASQHALLLAARERDMVSAALHAARQAVGGALEEDAVSRGLCGLVQAGLIDGPDRPVFGTDGMDQRDALKALARRLKLTDRGAAVLAGAPWVPHDRPWGGTENAARWRLDPARWAVFRV